MSTQPNPILVNLTEEQLLAKLKTLVPDLKKTAGYYNTVDATSISKDLVVEMKCRKDQNYDSVLFEEKKYNELLAREQKNKRFVVSTPFEVYSWNIVTMPKPNFIMHWVPTDKYKTNWVEKSVAFIKYSDAKVITNKLGFK